MEKTKNVRKRGLTPFPPYPGMANGAIVSVVECFIQELWKMADGDSGTVFNAYNLIICAGCGAAIGKVVPKGDPVSRVADALHTLYANKEAYTFISGVVLFSNAFKVITDHFYGY